MPDLSIIIISYNTQKILKDCLSSVFKNTTLNFEVIVVDNASTDDSVTMIKKNFPKVKLITNKQNLGFGGANNQAAKLAQSDYLLFLNSDTLVLDNSITNTYHQATSHKDLGAISCQLLNSDKSIQPSGGFFPNLLNLFTWQFGLDDIPLVGGLVQFFVKPVHPKTSFYKNNLRQIDWLTGAFLLIPKKIYQKVEGFDEKIFMYAEELELCYRIKKLGKKNYYYSDSSIIHLGGQSAGQHLSLPSEIKGIKYFFTKHYPKWQLPVAHTIFWCGSLLRFIAFGIIYKDDQKGQIYKSILG